MSLPGSSDVAWPVAHRIIRTVYPPVDLFEDIADPADWEAIASAEAKTNPRLRDEIGDLALVPRERRVAGPGASLVMAAFTHASPLRPGRFTDGSFGAWYAGDRDLVAIAETAFHFERFMAATEEPPGTADFRELTCAVRGTLVDLRAGARADCLVADDYAPGQALSRAARAVGADGIVYPSVRWPAGEAVCLFYPDLVIRPVLQARQFRYHWNGARMDRYFVHGQRSWTEWA